MSQDAREKARHIIDTVQAHMDGKKIRSRFKVDGAPWIDDHNPRWDFVAVEYEVKPEERKPIKLTVEYNGDGQPIVHGWDQPLPIGLTHFAKVLPEAETE